VAAVVVVFLLLVFLVFSHFPMAVR
jgi:hypothetical protein